jgi:hypothetical protein
MAELSGSEIRLGSGVVAIMAEGGTVTVIEASAEAETKFYFRMTVTHKNDIGKARPLGIKPTQACCADYDKLIAFLKQLENCDYVMTNLERVSGNMPTP